MSTCKICGQQKSTFTLPLRDDDTGEYVDNAHICSSCWDIIAEIVSRKYEVRIVEMEKRLDFLEQTI